MASHTAYLDLYYALICLSLINSPFFIIHHISTSLMCFKGFRNYDSSLNLWVVLQSHGLLRHFHMLTWVYFVLTSPFPLPQPSAAFVSCSLSFPHINLLLYHMHLTPSYCLCLSFLLPLRSHFYIQGSSLSFLLMIYRQTNGRRDGWTDTTYESKSGFIFNFWVLFLFCLYL